MKRLVLFATLVVAMLLLFTACGECEHTFGEWFVAVEPTCAEIGVKTQTCAKCGEIAYVDIDEKEHSYEDGIVSKEPTCTEKGVRVYTCSVCGLHRNEEIRLVAHQFDDGKIKDRQIEYTCKVCSSTKVEDLNIVTAYIDKAEDWTLVIETPGAALGERIGVKSEVGKIAAGRYSTGGGKRIAEYLFDFASLGLTGESWEYLGAKVEIGITNPNKPRIVNEPVKSCFCVKRNEITFVGETIAKLSDGVEFDLLYINSGRIRPNNLINEGGWYIPKWNNKLPPKTKVSNYFSKDMYYIFIKCTVGNVVCDLIVWSDVHMSSKCNDIVGSQ